MNLDTVKNTLNNFLENKILTKYIIIGIVVFSIFIIPFLPKQILLFFNNYPIKILLLILIFYISYKNLSLGIILTFMFILIIYQAQKYLVEQKFIDKITDSVQITSDNKIELINKLLVNPNINKYDRRILEDKIFNSIASDKHKFNTGLILLNKYPLKTSSIIDKLYKCNMKPHNVVKMTDRIMNRDLKDKYLLKIIDNIIEKSIDDKSKKMIIVKILNSKIDPENKLHIMKKIKNIPKDLKNDIIKNIDLNDGINKTIINKSTEIQIDELIKNSEIKVENSEIKVENSEIKVENENENENENKNENENNKFTFHKKYLNMNGFEKEKFALY